jgi:hypothetical protein
MNRHAASSEAHGVAARRPGDVPMFSWTKIRHLSSMKSEKNDISTISEPTSSLQKNHLTPAAGIIADSNKRQRHTEKLISPDLKNDEKTKLSIIMTDQHMLP